MATAGAISLLAWTALSTASAQEPTDSPAIPNISAPVASAAPATAGKLPYGVEDVVKLSRAQVSEGVILTYIQNSGTIYNLGPKDIVTMRDQGVSDRVINAMLDQRKTVEASTQAGASALAAPADTTVVAAAPTYSSPPPDATPASASSVYVIPYPAATSAYYGYYQPYYSGGYYGYYGYGYPSVSFGFGYGGAYYGRYGHYYGHYGHYYGGHHH